MICSVSQIDSFWNTFVLSNDCESSIRAIVIEPPCFGVALAVACPVRAARAAVAARAATSEDEQRGERCASFHVHSFGRGLTGVRVLYTSRDPHGTTFHRQGSTMSSSVPARSAGRRRAARPRRARSVLLLRRGSRARRRDQRAGADDRGAGRGVLGRRARGLCPTACRTGSAPCCSPSSRSTRRRRCDAIAPRLDAGRLRRLAAERRQRAADRRRSSARSGPSARS